MSLIKALLTGLMGVTLCMANISGIVTDTGTTPITGAVVRLEKGGQMATTSSDGRFTLIVSTAILPSSGKLLPNVFFAGISGNKLNVTIAERSAVEVATFTLHGKAISTVCKIFNAGSHFISLPYRGAGIYLYKVKVVNSEFVIKGNDVGGVSSGSALSSQSSSSNPLAKHALSTSIINDVIAATKTGYLNYRMVVKNPDTSGIVIKMIASAGTVTDIEGNVYKTVKIGNQEWMAENLRTTKYNDGSPISNITSNTTWDSCYYTHTGAYCYYANTTNSDSIEKFGALYNWYAVNTGKLAPAGWHVPDTTNWNTLENYLIANGYNYDGTTSGNKIAKAMTAKTDWLSSPNEGVPGNNPSTNNSSGFSALPGGFHSSNGHFYSIGDDGSWWSATEYDASYAWFRNLSYDYYNLYRYYNYYKSCGFSLRLVRDSN